MSDDVDQPLHDLGFELEVWTKHHERRHFPDVVDFGVAYDVEDAEELGLRVETESDDDPLLFPDFDTVTLRRVD